MNKEKIDLEKLGKANSKAREEYQRENGACCDSKPELQSGGFGTAALVCGITGIFFLPFILSTLAIIFGAIGMNRNQKYGKAGMWIGIVGLVGWAIMVIFVISSFLAVIASI